MNESIKQKLEEKKDGIVEVKISSDKLKAFIVVKPPVDEGLPVTLEKAMIELRRSGVVHGVNKEMIANVVKESSGSPVSVADGEPAVNGKDAEIHILFSDQEKTYVPHIQENGSVNLRDIKTIENVEVDQVLVTKVLAEDGIPGKTVTGLKLAAKRGKDVKLHCGRNTILSEDGLQVIAKAAGRPLYRDRKFIVEPVYKVLGNVDYSTGNIDFIGSVQVRGWVKDGFTVKAEGDIDIGQGIDDALLEAGGNVTVRYGIQGGSSGKIIAKGNVRTGYIYNCNVISGGSVNVRESIMHSTVFADREVLVNVGKGLIVGGLVRAGELVYARTIGSSLAQPTVIEVGVNPLLREEVDKIDKLILEKTRSLIQIKKAIELLTRTKQNLTQLPPDKERMLQKLKLTRVHLQQDLQDANDSRKSLESQLSSVKNPRIKVAGKIYPGVKIIIRGCMLNLKDTLNSVLLYEQNNEIKVGSYR